MDYVLLCAGKGTRLMPLTKSLPKSMIKVNGKSIIHHIIDTINEFDPSGRIIIITGHLQDKLYSHCRCIRGFKMYKHQPIQNGTADAIYLVRNIVENDFVVISGDVLITKEQLESITKKKNSILCTKVKNNLNNYGTLEIYGNRLLAIHERVDEPPSNIINCGVYHFKKDIFKYIERTEFNKRFNERIIVDTINNYIRDNNRFYIVKTKELFEINTISDLNNMNSITKGKI